MTRLYIVEQSGLEAGGHYQAYTGCVADGARQLGLDTVILANKRLRAKAGVLPPNVIPCFTYTWGEAEEHGKFAWEEGNIAYELCEAFRRVPPAPDDHVFLHTTGYRELRALLDWLTGKLPGESLPYFHLLLRYDPELLVVNYRHYAEYFARIAASPYLRQKILLHTDTHLLSQAFGDICRVPFARAPIPFDQSLLRDALAAQPARQPGDKLTIVYLGDAREEKGYQYLPQALSFLWENYLEPGCVRFVLQSNFNTPGGERGILSASQALAGYLHTVLKTEPLAPAEYYRILAESDIVLMPYSAQRYRYRSSGVLIEAMGAGKAVVTTAGSWMATQVGPDNAVLYETPAGLGPAIAEAIDRYPELSDGAAARKEKTLAEATGTNLVRHLLATALPPASRRRRAARRILFVMNGDAMVLENGASRVAHVQLRYLTEAGYDIVGLFLTNIVPEDAGAAAKWQGALVRSIAPFPIERAFVAGPGGRAHDPDQSPAVRAARQFNGAPLKAEFDFVAGFEFGGNLLRFLRTHRVDAVLLNYITNYPILEALGLDDVPVVCEMHDIQSFQRAIYGRRLVEAGDLDEEFRWLGRCAALLSLNARETTIVRERLPEMAVETTGVFLPAPPPSAVSLAGAKDLAEIVSSAGSALTEYRFEAAWESGKPDAIERLIAAGSLDLLYVSSAHAANASGLRWFLSAVYEPYLADRRVSMIVAGSIGRLGGWPEHPLLFVIDQVETLAPLYAAARVVVLPITEGAGSPVKTYEALAYGRPVVGTSTAFRGVDGAPGEFIVHDDPEAFADAILDLLDSEEARSAAAERSRRMAARLNDLGRYFTTMDRVFSHVLPGAAKPTPLPEPPPHDDGGPVEWPGSIQAVNRLVRSYADGAPFESHLLELLSRASEPEVDRLIDEVSRSLFERRDAAVLRTEQRLQRYLADPLASRLQKDAVFATRLALAGRRGAGAEAFTTTGKYRAVTFAGLPLTLAGLAEEADGNSLPLRVDGHPVRARRLADPRRLLGGACTLQAEVAPLAARNTGLRVVEIEYATPDGTPPVAVLRHSIRFSPGLQFLERDIVGGGFKVRGNGTADLAPGASGRLTLPRVVDAQHSGYVDLCFADAEPDYGRRSSIQGGRLPVAVMIDDTPAEIELIACGDATLARVFLGVNCESSDFGLAALTVLNTHERTPLRLLAAHSGLLLGPIEQAAALATLLTPAEQTRTEMGQARLTALARAAVASIIAGTLPDHSGFEALSVLSESGSRRDALGALMSQELARAGRGGGRGRYGDGDADSADGAIDDTLALLAAALDNGDGRTAIISPALPFEIVDDNGQLLAAETEAAVQRRGRSWRVKLPEAGERIRIAIDASFAEPGHPKVIEASGFHPIESPQATYRWTGPEATSSIVLPVVLDCPARLTIELGQTGKNVAADDYTVTCNGKPIPHAFEARDNGASLTADLPAARSISATQISLTVRHCFQDPPDRRVLGVVFRSLSLLLGRRPDAPKFGREAAAPRAVAVVPETRKPDLPELVAAVDGLTVAREAAHDPIPEGQQAATASESPGTAEDSEDATLQAVTETPPVEESGLPSDVGAPAYIGGLRHGARHRRRLRTLRSPDTA